MAEGTAQDLALKISECLEPSAVKAEFDILVSKNGGWKLGIKAPATRITLSPARSEERRVGKECPV